MTEVILDPNGNSATFELNESTGWLSRIALDGSLRRVCWLPHKRGYGGCIACWGQKVVIGASSGLVTILDFSDM
jgi:hypothetical protein